MRGCPTFHADLRDGRAAERFARGLLHGAGLATADNLAADRAGREAFDFSTYLEGATFTCECKLDRHEARSGNVAVEYYNPRRGAPSGIAATSADLWVFVLRGPASAWAARTADLRAHVAAAPCLRDLPRAGDGNASVKLYARPALFAALFHRLDLLGADALRALLRRLLPEKFLAAHVA